MNRLLLPLLACALLTPVALKAQVLVGGEVGTFFEANGISGAARRRPPAAGRMYLRPSATLWGKYTVTVDLMLSSEGRAFGGDARQSLNQYSIRPDWGWGHATLGDFADSYSPLTLNGIRVRGAGVEVRRGALTFSTLGGRTQRAVPGGAIAGTYARTVVGGRVGFGDPNATSLSLVMLSAQDDVGSLTAPRDTLFPGQQPDTTFVEDTLSVGVSNEFAVTPQENLLVALAGSLSLLGDRVALKGELAGSGYTRDLRSDVVDDPEILDRIPGIAEALFTPRISSTADYAWTLEARVRPLRAITTTVSIKNLGPGYVSLGAASLLSDRREGQVRTALRLRRLQATIDLSRQTDNLAGQKLYTTERDRLSASVAYRLSSRWTTSMRFQRATLGNDAPEPDRWIAYGNWMVSARQSFTFGRRSRIRSTSLDYSYRTTGDENPLRTSTASDAHAVNMSVVLLPARSLSITPTVGLVRSRFGDADWSVRSTFGLGVQLAALRGRWVSGASLGRSQFQQTTALHATATSRYQLTSGDALVLGIRASDYDNLLDSTLSFRDLAVNVRWAHRF